VAALRPAAQALAFVLELVLLYAFAVWGFSIDSGVAVQIVLGVGLPLLVIAFWSVWLAPRASRRLSRSTRTAVKATLFLLGSVALFGAGQHALAVVFELVSFVSIATEPRLERSD
jgi:hypothetical protein